MYLGCDPPKPTIRCARNGDTPQLESPASRPPPSANNLFCIITIIHCDAICRSLYPRPAVPVTSQHRSRVYRTDGAPGGPASTPPWGIAPSVGANERPRANLRRHGADPGRRLRFRARRNRCMLLRINRLGGRVTIVGSRKPVVDADSGRNVLRPLRAEGRRFAWSGYAFPRALRRAGALRGKGGRGGPPHARFLSAMICIHRLAKAAPTSFASRSNRSSISGLLFNAQRVHARIKEPGPMPGSSVFDL
jgi:hypothetical protein